jgi:uncharacterized membrane protein YGL010W
MNVSIHIFFSQHNGFMNFHYYLIVSCLTLSVCVCVRLFPHIFAVILYLVFGLLNKHENQVNVKLSLCLAN